MLTDLWVCRSKTWKNNSTLLVIHHVYLECSSRFTLFFFNVTKSLNIQMFLFLYTAGAYDIYENLAPYKISCYTVLATTMNNSTKLLSSTINPKPTMPYMYIL